MKDLFELTKIFRHTLGIKSGPVAVRVITNLEETPVVFKKPEKPLPSLCFAVMEAFKGKGLLVGKGDIGCTMGLTAMGFKKESEKLARKQTVQMGVFGNQEAAQKYFAEGNQVPPGSTQALVLSPLEKAVLGVDVCLFRITSDQAKWLLMANQYLTGERHNLKVGTGYQGVCGDVIAYPYLKKKINLTLNGVGDRIPQARGKNEIFVGVPGELLEAIAVNLTEIYKKPIFRQQRSPKIPQKIVSSRTGPRS
jgi:uncharacterized protein (DUF169 family)